MLNNWIAAASQPFTAWHGWGPYLWAPDCASGITNGGGVCYEREDYQEDGVHPAQPGLDKISQLLHNRLRRQPWYSPDRVYLPLIVK